MIPELEEEEQANVVQEIQRAMLLSRNRNKEEQHSISGQRIAGSAVNERLREKVLHYRQRPKLTLCHNGQQSEEMSSSVDHARGTNPPGGSRVTGPPSPTPRDLSDHTRNHELTQILT